MCPGKSWTGQLLLESKEMHCSLWHQDPPLQLDAIENRHKLFNPFLLSALWVLFKIKYNMCCILCVCVSRGMCLCAYILRPEEHVFLYCYLLYSLSHSHGVWLCMACTWVFEDSNSGLYPCIISTPSHWAISPASILILQGQSKELCMLLMYLKLLVFILRMYFVLPRILSGAFHHFLKYCFGRYCSRLHVYEMPFE